MNNIESSFQTLTRAEIRKNVEGFGQFGLLLGVVAVGRMHMPELVSPSQEEYDADIEDGPEIVRGYD